MKKKHIQYRSGLLIGLLILNTLSSCVNTRKELGIRDRTELGCTLGNLKRNYNSNPIKTMACLAIPATLLGVSALGIWGYYYFGNPVNIPDTNNGTSSTTTPPPTHLSTTTMPNLTITTMSAIIIPR